MLIFENKFVGNLNFFSSKFDQKLKIFVEFGIFFWRNEFARYLNNFLQIRPDIEILFIIVWFFFFTEMSKK